MGDDSRERSRNRTASPADAQARCARPEPPHHPHHRPDPHHAHDSNDRLARRLDAMPLTPEDVANKQFTSTRLKPGYDETEVDEFLDEVEAELTRLYRENDELRSKLSAAGRGGETAPQAPVAAQAAAPAAPDPAIARENDELRQKLAAAQRQLAEAANRPQQA